MPKLQDYESRVSPVGPLNAPRANADTFGAAIGRGIQQVGGAVSDVANIAHKAQAQDEISTVNAKIAETHAEFTKNWQEALKTADPSNAGKLREEYEYQLQEKLDSISDGIQTREASNHFTDVSSKLKQHFTETAYAGQAALQGIKSRQDFENAHNARSSALLNDPSALQMTLQQNKDDLESRVASGQIDRASAIELQAKSERSLSMSAYRGWVKLDPEGAGQALKEGKWDQYFSGELKHQMESETQQEIRGREADARRQEAERQRIIGEQREQTQQKFLSQIMEGSLDWKQIDNSNLDFAQKNQMLNIMNKHYEEKVKTDPGTLIGIVRDINDGKITDESQLLKPFYDGKLSLEDLNRMRAEFQGKKTTAGKIEGDLKTQFLKSAEQALTKSNPLLGIKDPVGEENYLRFLNYFYDAYDKGKKDGLAPQDMLNPESEHYLGKTIDSYRKTPQQLMKENIRLMQPPAGTPPATPTPEPRKKGESPEEYLKRTKK